MTTEELLDRILVPRPNGSAEVERVASFIETTLRSCAPAVCDQTFAAPPYGFQLMWSAALVLMVVWLAALLAGHRRVAFLCALLVPALLFVETEWLWSPVSGLWSVSQRNIVGTFPGQAGGPTLVLAAHYDTATHFGVTPHGRGGASRFCPP